MCARPLGSGRFDADKGGGGPGGGRYAVAAAVEEEKEGPLLDGASRGGGEGAGAIANVRYSYLFRMNRSSSELRSSPESAGGGLHRFEGGQSGVGGSFTPAAGKARKTNGCLCSSGFRSELTRTLPSWRIVCGPRVTVCKKEGERRRDATHLDLVLCPGVEGETLYFRDVGSQFPVHRGALDAEKDALVPRGPSRVPRAAVGAVVVARFLDEGEDLALVSLGGCLGRHGGAGPGCACE